MSGVVGIIAEYNPFHNGHYYHLKQSKRITNADYCVAIISGNFTQRGDTSIVNKWAKAYMAICGGADLVIELPTVYSISSAENFASGAIKILDDTINMHSDEEVRENAYLATIPSHNSQDAIECATIVALMIFYFRNGLTKENVFDKLNLCIKYVPFLKFNTTCKETLGNCLYAIYMSESFEDAIRKVLLMGGDTDINACIVGSVAKALYGMSETQKEESLDNLPDEFKKNFKKSL